MIRIWKFSWFRVSIVYNPHFIYLYMCLFKLCLYYNPSIEYGLERNICIALCLCEINAEHIGQGIMVVNNIKLNGSIFFTQPFPKLTKSIGHQKCQFSSCESQSKNHRSYLWKIFIYSLNLLHFSPKRVLSINYIKRIGIKFLFLFLLSNIYEL